MKANYHEVPDFGYQQLEKCYEKAGKCNSSVGSRRATMR
jgi:hypothetical protein